MNYFIGTLVGNNFVDPFAMKPLYAMRLISAAIVDETGEKLSLLSKEFNPSDIDEKILQIIVDEESTKKAYTPNGVDYNDISLIGKVNVLQDACGFTHSKLQKEMRGFTGDAGIIYGYDAYNDFAAVAPFLSVHNYRFRDLKQMADQVSEDYVGGDYSVYEDSGCPVPEKDSSLMSAVEKALWCKKFYDFLENFKKRYEKTVSPRP